MRSTFFLFHLISELFKSYNSLTKHKAANAEKKNYRFHIILTFLIYREWQKWNVVVFAKVEVSPLFRRSDSLYLIKATAMPNLSAVTIFLIY